MQNQLTTRATSPSVVKTEPIEVFITYHENHQIPPEDSKINVRQDNHTGGAMHSTDRFGQSVSLDAKKLKEESYPEADGSNKKSFSNSDGCLSLTTDGLGEFGVTPPISRKGSFSFDLDGANDLLIHRQYFLLHSRNTVCYIYCWGVDAEAMHISHICRVELGARTTLHHCCAFNHSDSNIGPYVQALGLYFLLHNPQNRALYQMTDNRRDYTPVRLYPDEVQAFQAAREFGWIDHPSTWNGINHTLKTLSPSRSPSANIAGVVQAATTYGTTNPNSTLRDEGCSRGHTYSESKPIPGDSLPLVGPTHSPRASPRTPGKFFGAHAQKDQISDWVELTATNRRAAGKGSNPMVCPEAGCSRSARRPQALKAHIYTHYRIQPFECERCPLKFLTHDGLKKHIGNSHVCPGCSNEMPKSDLKVHKTVCEKISSNSTVKARPMRTRSKA